MQIATDTTHHFIVAHEVLNVGHDRTALASMASKAQEGLGRKGIGVIADRGYYKGTEILDAEKAGVQTFIPKPMTSVSKAQGRFSKADFVFDEKADEYRCPAGQVLRRGADSVDDGQVLHSYSRYGCGDCPMHAQCTTASFRRIRRWEHEGVLDAMQRMAGPQPQCDEDSPTHRRACLRNIQTLDGLNALPDEDAGACVHRNQSPCAGLQPQAADERLGYC